MHFYHSISILISFLIAVVCAVEYPITTSGNYQIAGCGDRTPSIINLLNTLYAGLQTTLQQTPSTNPAYAAFFPGVTDPSIVLSLLTNIALGTNVPSNGRTWQPTIICANPDMPEIAAHWQHCQRSGVQATAQAGTQYVFLCPRIVNNKPVPEPIDCVGNLGNGRYSTGQGLARTQMGILLHELVHVYLASTPHLQPEIYGIHALLDLTPAESVINPASYVFYVANIMAKCTTFAPREDLRPKERILLDGGAVTTTVVSGTSAFDGMVTPSPSCVNDPLVAGFGGCAGVKASATFDTVTRITSGSWARYSNKVL